MCQDRSSNCTSWNVNDESLPVNDGPLPMTCDPAAFVECRNHARDLHTAKVCLAGVTLEKRPGPQRI